MWVNFRKIARKKKVFLIVIPIALILISGFVILELKKRGKFRAEVAPRSVQLHNLHNWVPPKPSDADYAQKVQLLARRDNIVMTEDYSFLSGLTPQSLKTINPNAKVYLLYDLNSKNNWESDVSRAGWQAGCTADTSLLQNPIPCADILSNDWWLRDGDGNILIDPVQTGNTRFLDVGKPGYKEAFLANLLLRMEGKGYDGVVFDYWYPYLSWIVQNNSWPTSSYPDDDAWFVNAWKPFIEYVTSGVVDGTHVTNGLRDLGYEIVGNAAGEWRETIDPKIIAQRELIDGVIYEQGAVDWWSSTTNPGGWLSGPTIEDRINALLIDPKIVWQAENGISDSASASDTPTRDRKQKLSLAMYYTGLPLLEGLRQKRSYGNVRNREISWEPLWDFYIGTPAENPVKMTDKFFWSRKYSGGLVLLNYTDESLSFPFSGAYVDDLGQRYAGEVTLGEHSALILKEYTTRVTGPASPSPSASKISVKKSPSPSIALSPTPTSTPTATPTAEESPLPISEETPPITSTPTPSPTSVQIGKISPAASPSISPSFAEEPSLTPTPQPSKTAGRLSGFLAFVGKASWPWGIAIILFLLVLVPVVVLFVKSKSRKGGGDKSSGDEVSIG